jgi:hypothetical protein
MIGAVRDEKLDRGCHVPLEVVNHSETPLIRL